MRACREGGDGAHIAVGGATNNRLGGVFGARDRGLDRRANMPLTNTTMIATYPVGKPPCPPAPARTLRRTRGDRDT